MESSEHGLATYSPINDGPDQLLHYISIQAKHFDRLIGFHFYIKCPSLKMSKTKFIVLAMNISFDVIIIK